MVQSCYYAAAGLKPSSTAYLHELLESSSTPPAKANEQQAGRQAKYTVELDNGGFSIGITCPGNCTVLLTYLPLPSGSFEKPNRILLLAPPGILYPTQQ
jgi:hypothetical protein